MKAKNGKVLNQSSVTNLQQMPDDVLVKIIDFVVASEAPIFSAAGKSQKTTLRLACAGNIIEKKKLQSSSIWPIFGYRSRSYLHHHLFL